MYRHNFLKISIMQISTAPSTPTIGSHYQFERLESVFHLVLINCFIWTF